MKRPSSGARGAVIELEARVAAPVERVFDLCRSIDVHVAASAATRERAVAGVTSGLVGLGDTVTFEARHIGLRRRLTSRITAFDRPVYFRDEQVRGPFRRFAHDHRFEPLGDGTRVVERFEFEAPFGPLGRVAERLVLARHLERYLREKLDATARFAESEEWRRFLEDD